MSSLCVCKVACLLCSVAYRGANPYRFYLVCNVCASDSPPELLIWQEELPQHLHAATLCCLHTLHHMTRVWVRDFDLGYAPHPSLPWMCAMAYRVIHTVCHIMCNASRKRVKLWLAKWWFHYSVGHKLQYCGTCLSMAGATEVPGCHCAKWQKT